MSNWKTYTFQVNGFEVNADYTEEAVAEIFFPLLETLTELQKKKERRILVFLAAPPAVGKSTLAEFLSWLSETNHQFTPLQAVGMDGFHYHSDFLKNHMIQTDNGMIPLQSIKGAPETFDLMKLEEALKRMKEQDIAFPLYDRTIHDVREDALTVTGSIVLIEGNYLLLDEPGWRSLSEYADYRIRIEAPEELLHHRLVARKERGGLDRAAAEAFYQNSDRKNVIRTAEHSLHGDLELRITEDNNYQIKEK